MAPRQLAVKRPRPIVPSFHSDTLLYLWFSYSTHLLTFYSVFILYIILSVLYVLLLFQFYVVFSYVTSPPLFYFSHIISFWLFFVSSVCCSCLDAAPLQCTMFTVLPTHCVCLCLIIIIVVDL